MFMSIGFIGAISPVIVVMAPLRDIDMLFGKFRGLDDSFENTSMPRAFLRFVCSILKFEFIDAMLFSLLLILLFISPSLLSKFAISFTFFAILLPKSDTSLYKLDISPIFFAILSLKFDIDFIFEDMLFSSLTNLL